MEPISFGKYLLCERIAEGGMAIIYRAKLTGPGGFEKTLVVKQIREELGARPEFVELFVTEAKTTVQLTHANIVPVFELGMVDGTYFLALDLVDGPPLTTLIAKGPFPPPLAAYVAEQILRGLDYAHRRDIVHRDLSPANVLCSRDGEVKLVDFGISAQVSGRAIVGGSRGYVAPEQEAGERVDARSDLYAVGVLLWEMLAGKKRDGALPEGVPAMLREIIERAVAPRPEDRWASAEAMLSPLTRYLRDTDDSTQSELARLVRQRAPDIVRGAATPASTSVGPSTRSLVSTGARPGNATPALGLRAMREVTFATRFVEAEPSTPVAREAPSPADPPPFVDDRPSGPIALGSPRDATRTTPRAWFFVGGLALVAVSVFAGARLRDTVTPIPTVRPAALPARVRITVEPAQAEVAIDGTAPAELPHDPDGALLVAAGRHTITATAPSRPPLEQQISLASGEQRALTLTMQAEQGRVELRSEPSGAEVKLGDRSLGTTPVTADVPLDAPLRFRFERREHAATERTVRPEELTGGPPRQLTITQRLEPLPRGQLTLGARPWAHVTIDGERKPDTPLVRLPLSAGPHAVRLACPATGKDLRFSVTVEAGKETRKVADLTGEPRLLDQ